MTQSTEPVTLSTPTLTAHQQIVALLTECEGDSCKFYDKNNTAAGTRLRKTYLELKNLAHLARKETQARINSIKGDRKETRSTEDGAEAEAPVVVEEVVEVVAAKSKKSKSKAKKAKAPSA